MNLKTVLTPKQSLNKAYLKEKVTRSNIELFKNNLIQFVDGIDEKESEEYVKNLVTKFLYDTYYNGKNQINTKGRIDLAIYEDKKPVVIIEAKRPLSSDMVTADNLNTKAIHELMLYYLQERVEHGNIDIKYLVITNTYEWFIFDSSVFDNLFYKNSTLMKDFNDWKNGRKARIDRDLFYNDIAKPFLKNLGDEIKFTWFDLRQVVKFAKNDNPKDDSKLIDLYKLLSPVHLLKQPFANDSNSLDTKFYNELLHIIGLEEKKDGGRKIIQRKEKSDEGSLLENTITMLVTEDPLHKLPGNGSDFGETKEERVFNIALELCITWINRILFLKLLEGQLLNYHKGDKQYRFLDFKTIPTYDELNKLFFQVLARKLGDRTGSIKEKFSHVPYLNSSLFDVSPLEDDTLRISNLDGSLPLKLHNSTVLKNESGKRREGELPTLQYLFEFLDAYDFTSEGKEEIQEENKTLINASVLGLIFEKINGYKDGSFFTPGFITMYMCKETIRKATVQKFNEAKGWKLETFDQLYNQIDDIKDANEIINNLKICDPAVGSGHFLVSALNEIIAIKSDLGILSDREGKRLREYSMEVVNDELIVSINNEEFFEYTPRNKESQRVQETLFHEKQTLIENCLFGVDINPNSVKICRLRLWIELLKNAYYTETSKYKELETLPNIDINIKQGNSLISRFGLDADLSKALKSIKYSIDDYRGFVNDYKNATEKEAKRGFEKLIDQIKKDFRTEIGKNDPKVQLLSKKSGELFNLLNQARVFEPTEKEKKEQVKKKEKLETEIRKLAAEVEEIKNSAIYKDAFEWRFEFPEVLNNEGKFIGFDSIIGNPPYIRIQDLRQGNEGLVEYYNRSFYSTNSGNYDLYVPFVELGHRLLKERGDFCFIMPHKFMNANYGERIREFITNNSFLRRIIHFGAQQVFADATTYTGLFFMNKGKNDAVEFFTCEDFGDLEITKTISFNQAAASTFTKDEWILLDKRSIDLISKLKSNHVTLESLTDRIFQGLKTSADKIYIVERISEAPESYTVHCRENDKTYELEKSMLYPLIKGGDSSAYCISDTDLLIVFPYRDGKLISSENIKKETPRVWAYLSEHKDFLRQREDGKFNNENWYAFGRSQALDVIALPKVFTPDIAPSPRFSYDEKGEFMFTGGVSGGYGIIPKTGISAKYLLAILNSPVAGWYISKTSTQMRGGWYSFESRYIKSIPFPKHPKHVDEFEGKVDSILGKKVDEAKWQGYVSQINEVIYQLYELTVEEIEIVEGQSNIK